MDSRDYIIKQIDKEFIELNKQKLFDSWCKIWEGSFWEILEGREIKKETEYFLWLIKNGIGYVAIRENEIVGVLFATFGKFPASKSREEKLIHDGFRKEEGHIVFLHELVVSPDDRSSGLGSELLKIFLLECKRRNVKQVVLYTEADSNSRHFYERTGFKFIENVLVERKDHPSGVENRAYYAKSFSGEDH